MRSALEASEIHKIQFLKKVTDQPATFLEAQNELLFDRDRSLFLNDTSLNEIGIPSSTDSFYQRKEQQLPKITNKLPHVLNIGSGSEPGRKLSAVNIDLSPAGKPDVIADAQHLPFKKGAFTMVRASHVLEHIPQEELINTLEEWRRVLHEKGELQVAVPDADISFQEIIDGKTPKGKQAFSLKESTAPLAQIYGLGYNNSETDDRWLHKVIFSYSLLEAFLLESGFDVVQPRTAREDLAAMCHIDDDSQNHYSLLVRARKEKEDHFVDTPLPEKSFDRKVQKFVEKHPDTPPTSYIIPVHNESKNLSKFLASLEHTVHETCGEREFIFVVNGCTDGSEEIVRKYAEESYLPIRIIKSETGIIRAFEMGMEQRNLQGFVGKIDADVILHPHALDLMHMYMVEHPTVHVTYSEPTPIDSQNQFNEAEHNPPIRSERLYIHGRTSLYRSNPFDEITNEEIFKTIQVEDMFFSFYYAYFHGLDSIQRTPHAIAYSKTINSYEDLVKQLSRSKSEMSRITNLYPPFEVLEKLLDREIHPSHYKDIMDQANDDCVDGVSEWTRLESTK